MTHPLASFFSKIPIFSDLSDEELNDLLRGVTPMNLKAGEILFREGGTADAFFVVQEGNLQIYARSNKGKQVLVSTLGPGEVLGEMAVLDPAPRSATVRSQTASTLLRMDRSEFDYLRTNFRPAAYKVIRSICHTLCERLRTTNAEIARLAEGQEAPTAAAEATEKAGPSGARQEKKTRPLRETLSRLFSLGSD